MRRRRRRQGLLRKCIGTTLYLTQLMLMPNMAEFAAANGYVCVCVGGCRYTLVCIECSIVKIISREGVFREFSSHSAAVMKSGIVYMLVWFEIIG